MFSPSNKLYFLIMIPLCEILLSVVGIRRTMALMCNHKTFIAVEEIDNIESAKLVLRSLMSAVESTFWKGNCLSRSIALQSLLQKNGISSTLNIGVRKQPKFRAHAWVEHKAEPLNAGQRVHENYQLIENLQLVKRATFL